MILKWSTRTQRRWRLKLWGPVRPSPVGLAIESDEKLGQTELGRGTPGRGPSHSFSPGVREELELGRGYGLPGSKLSNYR